MNRQDLFLSGQSGDTIFCAPWTMPTVCRCCACLVERGEMHVGQIHKHTSVSQSALSRHLAKVREKVLIGYRRDAQALNCPLQDGRVACILQPLQKLFCQPDEDQHEPAQPEPQPSL